MLPCTASRLTMVCSKGRTIWYLEGGGARFFFFYLRWKTSFFWRSTPDNFFFMFHWRIFLSYASPIMYVTVWCFLWSTYFSSISTTYFFFCPHFQQTFFFWLLWRQTIFFNFNLAPPPPPQISNGASLNTKQLQNTLVLLTQFLSSISKRNTPITKIVNLNPDG